MMESIHWLIFIEIVIKNVTSSIVYEGIGGVSILLFFYKTFFTHKKSIKKQTSEIKRLLFRHFKRI